METIFLTALIMFALAGLVLLGIEAISIKDLFDLEKEDKEEDKINDC